LDMVEVLSQELLKVLACRVFKIGKTSKALRAHVVSWLRDIGERNWDTSHLWRDARKYN
jgi:hypothetical protein